MAALPFVYWGLRYHASRGPRHFSQTSFPLLEKGTNILDESGTHAAEILKSDESCISNPEISKSQIGVAGASRLSSVAALYEDVNELESSRIPLLEKEGWMRDQENIAEIAKQPSVRADGVVRSEKS